MNILKVGSWILTILVVLLGVGYYVLYGQKTIQGNVNINKVEGIDKIYSYSVHSDFYYHVEKYDANGENIIASYSKLIPLKTSIGYDFTDDVKHPKTSLTTVKTNNITCLYDNDGRKIERYINTFSSYAKTFGTIVATQDQAYFDKGTKKVESILKNLYGENIKLPVQDIEKYYTSIENPVLNMKIKYYNLEEINKNLKSFEYIKDKKQWQPNIAEWKFNENDRIYLQYFLQLKNTDLYDYLKTDKAKQDVLIVKTVKINDGKLDKVYFKIKAKEKKIECLFQDTNGYMYVLIMKTEAKGALHKYLPDFLKIAYGINFIDVKNFDNWFAKEQERKESHFKDINQSIIEIQSLNKQLESLGVESSSLKHYRRITESKFDKKFDEFKREHGDYPNEAMLTKLNKELEDLNKTVQSKKREKTKLETKASEALSTLGFFGEGKLDERCPDHSMKCMQKIIKEAELEEIKEEAIGKLNNMIGLGGEEKLEKECPNLTKSCMQKIIDKE